MCGASGRDDVFVYLLIYRCNTGETIELERYQYYRENRHKIN
jgi:hypothetical protein